MDFPIDLDAFHHEKLLRAGYCKDEITTTFLAPLEVSIQWKCGEKTHLGLCLGQVTFQGKGYYVMLEEGTSTWLADQPNQRPDLKS